VIVLLHHIQLQVSEESFATLPSLNGIGAGQDRCVDASVDRLIRMNHFVCGLCSSFLPPAASGMTQEEMKSCRVFFNNFDRSKSGTINGWELQIALEAMGQNPQEEDIKTIIVQLGAEKNGTLGQSNEHKHEHRYTDILIDVRLASYCLHAT
jgi:hypothetical protein